MNILLEPRAIGMPLERLDGAAKLTGTAPYAFEHPVDDPLYLHPLQSAIARGRITKIDAAAARALKGVVAVITPANAPRLASDKDKELWVLQSDEIHFRGQLIGAVVAESPQIARHAADLVRVDYAEQPHEAELRADRGDLYAPEQVNPNFPTDTSEGDVEAALAAAAVTIDQTYTTPMEHNNPMEPHTTVARWANGELTLYDSTQGVHSVRTTLAPLFGLDPARVHVTAPHVGGGFGSKGTPHAHNVLAALAALTVAGRPVKFALTRQQMFSLAGYRTPTIQRIRLGADREGHLSAIVHDVVEQTSKIKEFAEQTAVASRIMYAAPNRRTTHRLATLDVPVPSWMRAPGETPGMYAGEAAMDELAVACGLDPIELRIRNEPDLDPESGRPWSGRHLVACLREGARRFGWDRRDPAPGARRRDGWLIGMGVASSTYPYYAMPGSAATIRYGSDQKYVVRIGAVDIGTGTRTALSQIAADALDCPLAAIRLEIADTSLPRATVEGGSAGISSWGSTIVAAARAFRGAARRRPRRWGRDRGRNAGEPGCRTVRHPLLRRAIRRGACPCRYRRDPGAADARRLLGWSDHQPAHRALAADRRHDHGIVDGAARGEHPRPALWPCRQPRFRRLPHRRQRRRHRYRGGLARRIRPEFEPDGLARHRRDRHRRRRRGDRQRGL